MEGEESGETGGGVRGGGEGRRATGVAGGVNVRAGDVRLFCGVVGVLGDESWMVGKVKEEAGVEGREWDFLLSLLC